MYKPQRHLSCHSRESGNPERYKLARFLGKKIHFFGSLLEFTPHLMRGRDDSVGRNDNRTFFICHLLFIKLSYYVER